MTNRRKLFRENNKSFRIMCKVQLKSTVKTPDVAVDVVLVSLSVLNRFHIFLLFPLMALNKQMPAGLAVLSSLLNDHQEG